MLERYYLDYVKRQYTGTLGEKFVEFITWNYAKGIKRNDRDLENWPGKPDFDAWFGQDELEVKLGIEVKTKRCPENCVIDDKVLYNLIRCQKLNSENRKDTILVFLIWNEQKIFYIPLSRLYRDVEIDVKFSWTKEILSHNGDVINVELLDYVDNQLCKMCDGISKLTKYYSSRQVNKVFRISLNRFGSYPYDFLAEYGFSCKAKLDNIDLQLFVQYYLEQRKWLQTNNVKIVYENVQRIKKLKNVSINQLDLFMEEKS